MRCLRRGLRTAALMALCLLSAGCGPGAGENLLRNPGFDRAADGKLEGWSFSQHAGERSFRFDIVDASLVIERVGTEVWGEASQTLSAAGLAGQTLEFSAEVRGELDDHSGPPTSPTGIGVRISGVRPGVPAALGPAIFSNQFGEPEIGPRQFDWTLQRVVFEVPANATAILLKLRLTMDGELQVRNPRLIRLAP